MDIKFIKREELQEKPDEKKLGFGKYFADYMLFTRILDNIYQILYVAKRLAVSSE